MGPAWMAKGNCRAAPDPEIFFCSDEDHPTLDTTALEDLVIETYCKQCPVRVKCFELAFETPGLKGIWGGTTTAMRKALRRGRPRTKCLKCTGRSIKTMGAVQVCRGCGVTWRWTT